jgi:hypothetical protein
VGRQRLWRVGMGYNTKAQSKQKPARGPFLIDWKTAWKT